MIPSLMNSKTLNFASGPIISIGQHLHVLHLNLLTNICKSNNNLSFKYNILLY